jgi:hypothetical protein
VTATERAAGFVARAADAAMLALPGVLIVYLAFNAGGFFPETVAVVTLVLLLALAARILTADRPFAGLSPGLAIAAGALALFTLWTLLSAAWSDSDWRALTEFDRSLLYLVALLLFGSVPRDARRTRWMVRGVCAGILGVCVIALITRLLPNLWRVDPGMSDRLSYPVTYWNCLGLLAALGLILCFHLTSSRAEPKPIRVIAAGAVPVLATTIYLTLSRGAILACLAGLVVYVLATRSRSLVGSCLACLPAAAVAVVVAYGADKLVSFDTTSAEAISQGKRVAVVLALCAVGAAALRLFLILGSRRVRWPVASPQVKWVTAGVAAGLALTAVVAATVALHAPRYISDQFHEFANGTTTGQASDIRSRLTSASSTGRVYLWKVAVNDGFKQDALTGSGAGTFENLWAQNRPRKNVVTVIDAHSLYAEALGELGIVGLVLIVIAVGTVLLVGFAMRLTGPNRTVYAALLAAGVAWALRAGIDWDWEMPVVTLWFFALGGTALARRSRSRRRRRPPPPAVARGVPLAACLGVAVIPLVILVSQVRLGDAAHDRLDGRNCPSALSAARSSAAALSANPEPYQIIGYCEALANSPRAAIRNLTLAVDRDPDNWRYRFGLAVARAAGGRDARQALRQTQRLDPRESTVGYLAAVLNAPSRSQIRRTSRSLAHVPLY